MVLKKLRIEELFTFKKGTNEFNKKVIFENAGSIPVYSGQTKNEGIIGYVNDAKYEGTYIRITTVGANAGHVDIIKGKFCLAQNNGILVPIDIQKNKNIDLTYISLQLKDKLKGLSKGEGYNSLLKADIENCHILLPTKEDGTFDLETQKKVVDKYTEVETIKKYIAKLIE